MASRVSVALSPRRIQGKRARALCTPSTHSLYIFPLASPLLRTSSITYVGYGIRLLHLPFITEIAEHVSPPLHATMACSISEHMNMKFAPL